MTTNGAARVAAIVLGIEGAGLLALAIWQTVALAAGDTESVTSAVALLVLTVVGAVIVLAFAWGVTRGMSWGRSGGIVTQVLILAVALGAVTGAYAHPLTAAALAVLPLAGLVALVLAARRAAAAAGDEASVDAPEPPRGS